MMKRDHTKLLCDIGELSGLFTDATSLETFLQRIVEMISDHMQTDVCSIYLFYEDTQELVLKATKGLNPMSIGKIKLKLSEGLTGLAVQELRPICERNASTNPHYRYFPEIGEELYESFLAVPILRGQTRIGAMVIQNAKKNYFGDEDIKVFRAITTQLANTIETAKLLMSLDEEHPDLRKVAVAEEPKFIRGRVGSPGLALAPAVVFEHSRQTLKDWIKEAKPHTLEDFHKIVVKTEKQLEKLQEQIEEKLSDVASLIFTAQILMLKDKPFIEAIEQRIRQGKSAAQAVMEVVDNYVRMFEGLPNKYLREKKHDVLDIGTRLLQNLAGVSDQSKNYEGKIVIAQVMYPSDILKLSSLQIKGIILLSGGITSHLSILARSLEIPVAITDCSSLLHLPSDTQVLLDAEQGDIHIRPDQQVIDSFLEKEEEQRRIRGEQEDTKPQTQTKDGVAVKLLANINLLSDLKVAMAYKAEGVGLYRTEFPFIVRSNFPSEEEQFLIYQKLVEGMPDKEIVFRTLDIGGDKVLSYYDYGRENNPYLGMRSIRFSLKHKEVFKPQLRAILRAGARADLKILFPMISSLDEFIEARDVLKTCMKDLKKEGLPFHRNPAVGVMIELPSVLEIIEELAREADFFSIGTNDFIQYMLAIDRTNEKVADLYLPHHPSILRALKRVADAAQAHHGDISVCGDMAHSERYVFYFLGIGIRKFSMDSRYLPKIQKAIAAVDMKDLEEATVHLLEQNKISQINKIMEKQDRAVI